MHGYDCGLIGFDDESAGYTPTPAEIAAACAAIRAKWGRAERRRRYHGLRRQAWLPPQVSGAAVGARELSDDAA